MRTIILSVITIGILTGTAPLADDSVGRIVIYLEVSSQPEAPCTIHLDRIRMSGWQGGIDLQPYSTEISSEAANVSQILLADSAMSPGNYHEIGFQGRFAIDPPMAADRKWDFVPIDTTVSLDVSVSAGMAETFFFRSRIELPPDTSGTPEIVFGQIRKGIPPRNSQAYVSNEGSDDLSVVDRVTGQVVGTIMVGEAPRGLAVARRLGLLFAANTESNTISVVEIESRQLREELHLDFGDDPTALCVSEDERYLICANRGSNSVTVFDLTSLQSLINFPVGSEPVDLVEDPVTNRVFVVNSLSDNVIVFNLSDFSEIQTISVGSNPVAIDVDAHLRQAYVANPGSGYVTVINLDDRAVSGYLSSTLSIGDVAVDEFAGVLYCVNRNLEEVELYIPSLGTSVQTIPVGKNPQKVTLNPERSELYVTCRGSNNVFVINKISRRVVRTIATGRKPYMMVFP